MSFMNLDQRNIDIIIQQVFIKLGISRRYLMSKSKRRIFCLLFCIIVTGTLLYYLWSLKRNPAGNRWRITVNRSKSRLLPLPDLVIPYQLNIINLHHPIQDNFTCIKTKHLFQEIRTTICVHNQSDLVSAYYYGNRIYEEDSVQLLLRVFFKQPQLGLIDIGANIGTFTMFAAAMNHVVIAVEYFRPNYLRIGKALQIERLENYAVLIGNTLYSKLGAYVDMSTNSTNTAGRQMTDHPHPSIQSSDNPYIVKTMRFDDLLPIMKQIKVRRFLLKIDIDGSEYYVFENGANLFDYIDIPIVYMKWNRIREDRNRIANVVDFLTKHQYVPTSDTCNELILTNYMDKWPGHVFWMKMDRSEIC